MTRTMAVLVMVMLVPSGASAQGYIPFTDYLPPTTLNPEEFQSGYND